MAEGNLVELRGRITHLYHGSADRIDLVLLEETGRLLALTYKYQEHEVSEGIFQSLKLGMTVTVQVQGPVEQAKDSYRGVGIISVVTVTG